MWFCQITLTVRFQMKIEVNIEEQLEAIWKEMGLDAAEIDLNYEDLNNRVQALFKEYLISQLTRRRELQKEVEEAEEQVKTITKQFCITDTEPLNKKLPLIERLNNANLKKEKLKQETNQQKEHVESLYEQILQCFGVLEIEEPGAYSDIGSDFSTERVVEMETFLELMNQDIGERKPRKDVLIKKIQEMQSALKLPVTDDDGKLGDATFSALESERTTLSAFYKKNQRRCKKLYQQIHQLESYIKVQNRTECDYEDLSDSKISRLHAKVKELDDQREVRNTEYVSHLKSTLLGLWKELRVKIPTEEDFPAVYTETPTKKTVAVLESEVLKMESLKQEISQIVKLLDEKDQIVKEYDEMLHTTQQARYSRDSRHFYIDDQRTHRRYDQELPKIDAELIVELSKYKEEHGEALLLNGEDLLATLLALQETENNFNVKKRTKTHKLK